ncbi:uncharacterized protein LOC121430563 [Lytechinus variegatus]|uniref:uncharacterized protein LOC121430563 n=1 Tax=Lytechinus variegatus TaxID=7654 RepID=UPI001BB16F41|nr:uncharacterized protein LOC121430563 [Lytechinus variegatus]
MDTVYMVNRVCLIMAVQLLLADVGSANNTSSTEVEDGDYLGCYPQTCFDIHALYHLNLTKVTPDSCTATCKTSGYRVATVYNRTECSCSCELPCIGKIMDPVFSTKCGLPCRGDGLRFCGGYLGASVYEVKSGNASKSNCTQTKPNGSGTDESEGSTESWLWSWGHLRPYVVGGASLFLVLLIIIIFACLRNRDRRLVYSPRNHSRRWRADASSRENKERPPTDPQTSRDQPQPPLRNLGSGQQPSEVDSIRTPIRNTKEEDTSDGILVPESDFYNVITEEGDVLVPESKFYHVLNKEDDCETCSQEPSMANENAYAYADCRAYTDSFTRSAAFIRTQADSMPRCPEGSEEIEHEMINNELYAISKK